MELIGRAKKILVSIMALVLMAGATLVVNRVDVKVQKKFNQKKLKTR